MIEVRVKILGNIYGRGKGTSFAGNVYDTDGLAPTLNTMGGGNREPLIIEAKDYDKGQQRQ